MNATQVSVPLKSGSQGESIENHVLDRVSGEVEKHMGNVVEDILTGASVPVSVLIALDGANGIRRAYVAASSDLTGNKNGADPADRQPDVEAHLEVLAGNPSEFEVMRLTVANAESTIKSKLWTVPGLTQTAEISGSTAIPQVAGMFVPSLKSYTLGALVAKLEDLALVNEVALIYVNQNFPEVYVAIGNGDAEFVSGNVPPAFSATILAQVNGVFVSGTAESNPAYGFESGGSF